MITRRFGFNFYLGPLLLLVFLCNCQTEQSKQNKRLASLRVHQEMNPDPEGRSQQVTVFRAHPVKLTVGKEAFLSERNVKEAAVVNSMGGFSLSIQFDREGTWLLEEYTTAGKGKHIAIFSQFVTPPEEKINQGRWLAAPKIQAPITNGLLVFTPDASREESEEIALGLNHVARELETGKEIKW